MQYRLLEKSWSISKRVQDTLFTVKSDGESVYNIVKLEIYPFREVVMMEKTQWWRKAEYRCQLLTLSAVNPLQIQFNKVLQQVGKNLNKLKVKMEKKRLGSSGGFWT